LRFGLIIYGSLQTLSGSFLYDRKLVEYLQSQGDSVEIVSMPWERYSRCLLHNWQPQWLARLESLNVDALLQDEFTHPSLFRINSLLRQKATYPIFSIVHHLRSSEDHSGMSKSLYRRIEGEYLQTVDGFVFNSQTTKNSVQDILKREVKGIVAHPAGDTYGPGLDQQTVIDRCSEKGPLRILFVGNIIPRKGLHTLLWALKEIEKQDWVLEIAGRQDIETDYVEGLKQLVLQNELGGRVKWLGELSEKAMRTVWRRNQVLVVPSQYEGFGIVYLEGMGFGLPAVASSAGAAWEIVTPGQNGVLVPPYDVEALSTALRKLCRDRHYLKKLSLGAWQRFAEFPTWEETMASVRIYFKGWISESAGG
jgi:glycosyltransferase involved in cell wall biosynthesis